MDDIEHAGAGCERCGPSWWDPSLRGCYEDAKARYATNARHKSPGRTYREVITGSYPNSNGKPFIEQEEI